MRSQGSRNEQIAVGVKTYGNTGTFADKFDRFVVSIMEESSGYCEHFPATHRKTLVPRDEPHHRDGKLMMQLEWHHGTLELWLLHVGALHVARDDG